MLQLVDHVLLAGAHARGYLHGVVAREHGVLDGGQHLQRVGKGGGAPLGANARLRGALLALERASAGEGS